MADFVTYCRLAVVDDHDVSGCMNHQLEVETDYGAPKWTESKTNVYRRSPKLDVERRSPKLVVERRSPELDVEYEPTKEVITSAKRATMTYNRAHSSKT